MCDMAVDLAAIAKEPQFEVGGNFSDAFDSLRPLSDNGAVLIDGYRIQITEKGRPFARLVASAFDTYLTPSGARHSPAV